MARIHRRYTLLIGSLIALAVFLLLHRNILPWAARWLDVGEPPVASQAVFVLLGDADTRPFVAAALYNTGYAQEVLFAQVSTKGLTQQQLPEHVCYQRVLRHRGVPDKDIRILGSPIVDTMTESKVLLDYLETNPEAIVTVVTNHFHTRRTRWSLRRNVGKHADRLRYVSAPTDDFDAEDWWLHMRGFDYVLFEYIKLFAYWLFYGHGLWYLAALFVAALLFIFTYRRTARATFLPKSNET